MEKNSSERSIFWARPKSKIGYEVVFHAYRDMGSNLNPLWYMESLCRGGERSDERSLRKGTPKVKYQCEICRKELGKIVATRIKGETK